ncbi:MAG: hypothetical protein CM1200mP18_06700 [Gammaproteobacteria bacterium]|nr:MAG: hypothetical protein CM1200mP18_06700 [Gammaproteobacteria bacterium]
MKFGVLFTSHPHTDLEPYPHVMSMLEPLLKFSK